MATSKWIRPGTGCAAAASLSIWGRRSFGCFATSLEHPGHVFSRERLLDAVWGGDSDIEVRTVDVYVRRLRKAINSEGKPDLVRTVRSAGYALDLHP